MNNPLSIQSIENRLITIKGHPVLIDRDVAKLFGVATRDINKAVKNNPNKFPENYTIALTALEKKKVVENFHHLQNLKYAKTNPKALRKQDIDIVYIAFDTDEAAYDTHFAKRPWDTFTDLPQDQLEDYRIVATPTLFLLDADLKIRMRPKSVAHLMSWLGVQ